MPTRATCGCRIWPDGTAAAATARVAQRTPAPPRAGTTTPPKSDSASKRSPIPSPPDVPRNAHPTSAKLLRMPPSVQHHVLPDPAHIAHHRLVHCSARTRAPTARSPSNGLRPTASASPAMPSHQARPEPYLFARPLLQPFPISLSRTTGRRQALSSRPRAANPAIPAPPPLHNPPAQSIQRTPRKTPNSLPPASPSSHRTPPSAAINPTHRAITRRRILAVQCSDRAEC